MVRLSDVAVCYRGAAAAAIRDLDLAIEPGETVLLCGRSGGGKSTVLNLLNGIVPHLNPAEVTGRVEVAGLDPGAADLHETGRAVSTVFQNPRTQFFCADSTAELAFASENAGLPAAEIRRRIDEAGTALCLGGLLDRPMSTLSGGQRQQVAIGASVVNDPRLYVLDEPTSNLDRPGIDAVAAMIARLRARGATIVIAEHRLHFLRGLIDRVLVIDEGRIAAAYAGAEFFALPEARRRALGLRTLTPPAPSGPVEAQEGVAGIVAEDLEFAYRRGHPVLDLARLHLPRGRIVMILGANGAGKSTLIRLLAGLEHRHRGRVRVDGTPLSPRARLRRSYLVMQDVNRQLFAPTVAGELRTGRVAAHVEPGPILAGLGLAEVADRHPGSLSGGQRQRVAIAAAESAAKDLYFFDEPTSGLDQEAMAATGALLRRLADAGRVVVVVTHDTELVAEYADVVVEL